MSLANGIPLIGSIWMPKATRWAKKRLLQTVHPKQLLQAKPLKNEVPSPCRNSRCGAGLLVWRRRSVRVWFRQDGAAVCEVSCVDSVKDSASQRGKFIAVSHEAGPVWVLRRPKLLA